MEAQLILQTVLSKIETPQVHSAHSGRATTYPSEGLPAPRLGFPGEPQHRESCQPEFGPGSQVTGCSSKARGPRGR